VTDWVRRATDGTEGAYSAQLAEVVHSQLFALTEVGGLLCRVLIRNPDLGSCGFRTCKLLCRGVPANTRRRMAQRGRAARISGNNSSTFIGT
jgi:hypothetical protein